MTSIAIPRGDDRVSAHWAIHNVLRPFSDHVYAQLCAAVNAMGVVDLDMDCEVFRAFDIRLSDTTRAAADAIVDKQIAKLVEWANNHRKASGPAPRSADATSDATSDAPASPPARFTHVENKTRAQNLLRDMLGDNPVAAACAWRSAVAGRGAALDPARVPTCDRIALVRDSKKRGFVFGYAQDGVHTDHTLVDGSLPPRKQRMLHLAHPGAPPGHAVETNAHVEDKSWMDKVQTTLQKQLEILKTPVDPWERGRAFQRGFATLGTLDKTDPESVNEFKALWNKTEEEAKGLVNEWWKQLVDDPTHKSAIENLHSVQDALCAWHVELFQEERGMGIHLEPLRCFDADSAQKWFGEVLVEAVKHPTLEMKARVLFAQIHQHELTLTPLKITKRHVTAAFTTSMFSLRDKLTNDRARFKDAPRMFDDTVRANYPPSAGIYIVCAMLHGCIAQ
jgi:hypothetical protein